MELKQLEYILKIAEENNITHAASRLFITQSALNQQLLKLEKELGTPLFHRSRTDWRPTETGQIYIDAAREILAIRKTAYDRIGDLTRVAKGRLSVAFTPGRGIAMFTAVYPRFHSIYPEVKVEPVEMSVKTMLTALKNGDADIGFMTLESANIPTAECIELATEEIFLAIPPALLSVYPELLTNPDISQLKYEPFVLMYKESTLRGLTDRIFENAGFVPNILFETANTATVITMIQSGLCCGIIPEYYLKSKPDSVAVIPLPHRPSWKISAACKKGGYLSRPSKAFIELAKKYWNGEL